MENILEKEFNYYKINQKDLFKKYPNKFLVIKDEKIEGSFKTISEAYEFASKNFIIGTFLIQQCLEGKESYTQSFHSRAIFA